MNYISGLKLVGALIVSGTGWAMAEAENIPYGPFDNPSDQIRLFEDPGDFVHGFVVHERISKLGINTYNYAQPGDWDYVANRPATNFAERAATRRRFFARFLQDGISVIDQTTCASDDAFKKLHPRIRKDGTRNEDNLDASNSRVLAVAEACTEANARTVDSPVVIGFKTADEVRFTGHFSFTPEAQEAYRHHAGRDLPKEVVVMKGGDIRNPPHWKTYDEFPVDRIVPDDHPVLDFYRWSWKTGDGWNDFFTRTLEAYRRGIGRRVFGLYTPSLRTPAFWGSGGRVEALSHWTYPYPEPYRTAYNTAEQQAMARESDKMVIVSVQGISYRSQIAPIGVHPDNEPAWARRFPNCRYPTAPADMLREALWSAFARKVDGVGTYGVEAILDESKLYAVPPDYDLGDRVYRCADPTAEAAIGDVFRTVAPLGPLLRAIPERPPLVAVLESYATQIFCEKITWDCQGDFFDAGTLAVAANLAPYAINEEEVALRGIPDSVKVLLMADCEVLTKGAFDRVLGFVKRGGLIVADKRLVPALTADAELPSLERAFSKTASDHDDGAADAVVPADVRDRAVKRAAAELKAIAARRIKPYADSDNADILVHARTWKDADYIFPLNDRRTFGDYVGPWHRVMEKGLPNSGHVVLNRAAGAVYDLVRHQSVPFEVRDGRTSIPVSFETTDGKVLMAVSRPLRPLMLTVHDAEVTVRSPDVDVMIPIEVRGPGLRPFTGVIRDGVWSHDFGRLPSGTITVLNLADGKSREFSEAVKISMFAYDVEDMARQAKVSLPEMARRLREAGVSGVDVKEGDPQAGLYADMGLPPVNMYSVVSFCDRLSSRMNCEKFVSAAVRANVPRIMCVLPPRPHDMLESECMQAEIDGLKLLTALAADKGISVSVEPVGSGPCSSIDNLRRYLEAVPELECTLDSGNLYYATGRNLELQLYDENAGRIRHVHLKDLSILNSHQYVVLGEGAVKNEQIIRQLRQSGYDGWLTLENPVGPDIFVATKEQIATVRAWWRTDEPVR